MTSRATIQIEHLTAGYGQESVLSELGLTIRESRISALIGRNGSGKTTLMRCINGVLKPTAGRIVVKGKDVSHLSREETARLISVVHQTSFSPFSFSVLEMILMGGASRLRSWVSPGKEERRRAAEICGEVGIADLLRTPFNHLSGGQRQLVMLGRALFQETPVMLLDEPNSHLDFCNEHRIMNLIVRTARQRNMTALITLHDPNLALLYCDEVVLLKGGRVIAQGPTLEIMTDQLLRQVLGDNVRIDTTVGGLRVVVPQFLAPRDTQEAGSLPTVDEERCPAGTSITGG